MKLQCEPKIKKKMLIFKFPTNLYLAPYYFRKIFLFISCEVQVIYIV